MKSKETKPKRRAATRRHAEAPEGESALSLGSAGTAVVSVARQLRSWTDSVLGIAAPAADLALNLARTQFGDPRQKAAISKAGSALRSMREAAGMTMQEVATAVDLSDPTLIEAAEGGKIALPFEMVLRLAGVLGRSDPLTATMRLARAYNPDLWKALDQLGVGRLVVQAGREREFANIYRGNDEARRLNDEDFAKVLDFTKTAFDMAVDFRRQAAPKRAAAAAAAAPADKKKAKK